MIEPTSPYDQILSERCAICKECCTEGVPEGICGFNTIEMILSRMIPEELIRQLVVYRVLEKKLDYYSLKWWHFPYPNVNLLRDLTIPFQNIYEFLAIPYAQHRCIFLGAIGCQYPGGKAFDCSMFPYHFECGEFKEESWCELTRAATKRDVIQRQLHQAIGDYRKYSLQHREEYAQKLSQLKQIYHFREITLIGD